MTRNSILGVPLLIAATLLGGLFIVMVIAIAAGSGLLLPPAPDDPSPTPTTAAVASPGASPVLSPSAPPTPSPIAQPSLSPEPTASAGPSATPATSPTTSPTPSLSPSPTASATPTAGPTMPTAPPQSRFREIVGFPAPGEIVRAIASGGPGFVAVGYVDSPTAECQYRQDARIWSSPDGETWTRRDGDALSDTLLTEVIDRGGTLFAFGYVGNDECPAEGLPEDFGNNVWRSSDGISWEQITSGLRFHSPYDRWQDVTLAGNTFVVVGARGELGDEEARGGVWTSTDGIDWVASTRAPRTYSLESVAARGSTVVAWGTDINEGLAWYSTDAGATWRRGSIEGGYLPYSVDLVAGSDRFVAVTRACCEEPTVTVGLEFVSTDGISWRPATSWRQRGERGLITPGGVFVTLTDSPETRLSGDGVQWRSGPPGPAFNADADFHTAAAAGPLGVVTTIDRGVGRERLVRAFFAPASEFDIAAWTGTPEPSIKAVIGRAYDYELYTHCGTAGTRVVMHGSVWIVDEVVSGPFRDPSDRGTVTMTGPDTARYANRRGGTILLERSDPPPPWPRCA